MPTIDDFDIPAVLLTEMRAIADRIKTGPLLALAKAVPTLATGVRLTAANIRFIRQRLLPDSGHLSNEIRDFLAAEGLNGQLVVVLSGTVLTECLPQLLAIYGRERMLTALLLDSRPEVRQLAVSYCSEKDWQSKSLPDRAVALTVLADTIQPFLSAISPLVSVSSSCSEPVDEYVRREELVASRNKISALEERLRQAKDHGKTVKKLEAKVNSFKNQITSFEETIERERHLRLAAQKTAFLAEERVETLRQGQDRAVQDRVDAEMQSVVRTWLVEPMRLDLALDATALPGAGDILDRVHSVLSQQAERDRHYGNRCMLRDRLLELRQAEDSLLRAASESLNPLPELTALIAELQGESDRIEALLGEGRQENLVVRRLAAMIPQATDEASLVRIKNLLHEMETAGVVSPVESRELYRSYNSCLGRLFDRFAVDPLSPSKFTDPALIVGHGRDSNGRFLWILDGYNILLGLSDLFAESLENDGRPGLNSRNQLLTMIDALLAKSSSLADVVFDGPTRNEENFSPHVKVIYSGGGGLTVRDRADQAIVDRLERPSNGPSISAIVVTNDRTLTDRCLALGARVMPLQQFASILVTLPVRPGS